MGRIAQRIQRRTAARNLRANKRAEAAYVSALRGIANDVANQTMAWVRPRLDGRTDADKDTGVELEQHVLGLVLRTAERVGPAYDRMSGAVNATNKKGLRVVGVQALSDHRIAPEIARRRAENVDLVVKAGRAYAQGVREVFDDPANDGLRVEELAAKLLKRGSVSASRAELIARDQTLKLNGALTQIRQTNAGISSYVWSTSLDERVREEHAALEGQTFEWSSPPEPGHPGEDYQCRCTAIPVIEGLEGI